MWVDICVNLGPIFPNLVDNVILHEVDFEPFVFEKLLPEDAHLYIAQTLTGSHEPGVNADHIPLGIVIGDVLIPGGLVLL